MEKKKKIYFGIIMITLILMLTLIIYFYSKKNQIYTIQATVSFVGGNYLLVQDDQGKRYSLVDDDVYHVGDKVTFEIKDMKKTNPIQGKLCSIKKVNQEVESSNSFTSSLKSGFIELIDFLFYGGTIQGKTFSSLSNQAKIKVLKLAFMIDSKIEEKFPDYKDTIKDASSFAYDTFREKVIVSYLDLATKVCQENEESCTTAKEGLGELKKNGLLTWQFIKNISSSSVSKLKSWYEVWRDTND